MVAETCDALTAGCRHWEVLVEPELRGLRQLGEHLAATHPVDLVEDQYGMPREKLPGDEAVPSADRSVGLHQEQDHVHVGQSRASRVVETPAEQRPGLVNPWGVTEYGLDIRTGKDPAYLGAGGLRFVGNDRHLLTKERV